MGEVRPFKLWAFWCGFEANTIRAYSSKGLALLEQLRKGEIGVGEKSQIPLECIRIQGKVVGYGVILMKGNDRPRPETEEDMDIIRGFVRDAMYEWDVDGGAVSFSHEMIDATCIRVA